MLRGFKDFIMRGNVVDLAVGIVIGAAFTGLVSTFTDAFLHPIINRIGGGGTIAGQVSIGGPQTPNRGAVTTPILNFLIVAATLYFLVVLPMNKPAQRPRPGQEPPPPRPPAGANVSTQN